MTPPDDIPRPWLASYKENVPHTYSGSGYKNLGAFLEEMFARHADRPAFSNFRRTLSYREIGERARAFAAYLQHELGYQPGDRLALMMPNILQFPICLYGCMLAGVVAVNVNPLYTTRELEHQLNDSGVRGIVLAENFTRSVAEVRPQVPGLHDIIVTCYGDEMGWFWSPIVDFYVRHIGKLVPKYYLPGVIPFKKLLKTGRTLPFTPYDARPDDMAMLQYTGGTTGVAKGAMLSHANLLANAGQIKLWITGGNIGPGDVLITALPLYHIFCCTINSLGFSSCGVHAVLVTNPRDIKSFVTILRRHPPTMITGLNTLFKTLLNTPAFRQLDFSRLRYVIAGGMPLEKTVSDEWQALTGNVIVEGYGLTEASPLVCVNHMDTAAYNGTIGYPMPGTDVTLRDDSGALVPPGEPGEMWIRGPQVMQGYWQQPDETRRVLEDGWLKSGDIAVMRPDGALKIVDRKKDMILVSGFNVYPSEVEAVLAQHPAVLEVACIGVPCDGSGERVKACIVVRPGEKLTVEALQKYAAANLTGYKRPKAYEFFDSLPKSNVGKILKRELLAREKAKAGGKA
ncbi:AMP-binding protein [uncultured Cardiobacterium sp.]|uniref:AMP-binding protein n=1 Tax=uncultured Cardiobacterium sp. TaxID=417619 RepID=UPI002613B81F|nr:AMP-binding protein [uncultured Cardiobacterium sp.]